MIPTLHAPVYTLDVRLDGIDPAIWRTVEVPSSFTLRRLHDVLQVAMGWKDSHMHLFIIGGERYGFGDNEYDEDELDDSKVLLGDVVQTTGAEFEYLYDFGDDWHHTVRVERIRRDVPRSDVPRVLAGERACPPEDCGGVHGYGDLVAVMGDPGHEDRQSLMRWLGGAWDPEAFDAGTPDRRLARLRRVTPPRRSRAATPPPARSTSALSAARGRTTSSAAVQRVADLLLELDELHREFAVLPPHIVDTTADLLRRFAALEPGEFLRARDHGLWLAAALHASFMLHPRRTYYPLQPMTLEILSEMFGFSTASISTRSRQLRDGLRLTSRTV